MSPARVRSSTQTLRAFQHALKQFSSALHGQRICLTSQHRPISSKSLRSVETHTGPTQRLQTLAIETSCDDTSVAVLAISAAKDDQKLKTDVLFHERVTADSDGYGGIHPLVALDSHQTELGHLVQRAIQFLRPSGSDRNGSEAERRPDFISVTRGPGMRSNLSVGLNIAKGLALAWNVPLVGVHHMQAHALTPRLCATLDESNCQTTPHQNDDGAEINASGWHPANIQPRFPFLSLLVSGGHTMLIDSASLIDHRILAETQDIAIGDYLDKAARAILPASELGTPYGKALEDFAFRTNVQYDYTAPRRRQDELESRETEFGWSLSPPLAESKGGEKSSRRMVYSFAGLLSSVQRIVQGKAHNKSDTNSDFTSAKSDHERRNLAQEVQRVAFEHLGSRIMLHLEANSKSSTPGSSVETVVVSGGVASNRFLRHVLRKMLDARDYSHIKLQFPPPELCTDNALMIAWAGMEMYDAGYESELSIEPLRKWTMDASSADGGILGVGGWKRVRPG